MIDFVTIPEDRLKIFRNKVLAFNRKLRNFFDVKMSVGDDVKIEGNDGMEVARTKEIVKAFGRGFSFEDALELVDEEYVLDMLNTSEFSGKSKNRMIELKGRIIGSGGKAKESIEKASGSKIAIYGKTVSIIGKWDSVQIAKRAVLMLLGGAKHSTVFKYLEKHRTL